MAICRPTLFLLTVKEILLVHFIITNFWVAHKMLCTPWLRNPLTTSRLSCLGRKAALATIWVNILWSAVRVINFVLRRALRRVLTDRF
jgi:hypothetical protein